MPATQALVQQILQEEILTFVSNFKKKYAPRGSGRRNLLNKANNPFILALGEEIVIYSALMRSLDSSLGNCLEKVARRIAEASYYVSDQVEGDVPLSVEQQISELMSAYVQKRRVPRSTDLHEIKVSDTKAVTIHKTHKSDYHLVKKSDERQHFLLELKIGGDLDNKKARSEKQALLEQYAILKYSQHIRPNSLIHLYFATAYNKFGEDETWKQERVRQFFGEDELLIGRDFWNFICESEHGNTMVLDAYQKQAPSLKTVLEGIIKTTKAGNVTQVPLPLIE
jgi:hypothetical protein